jgi:hypothetical protein
LPSAPHIKARAAARAEIRELAGHADLRALDWPAIILRQR